MSHGSQCGSGNLSGLPPHAHGSAGSVSFEPMFFTIASIFNSAAADDADNAVADALAQIARYCGADTILVCFYDWVKKTASVQHTWPEGCGRRSHAPDLLPFSSLPEALLRQHRVGKAVFASVHSNPARSVPALSIPLMAQGKAIGACSFSGLPGGRRRRDILLPGLALFCTLLTGFLMRIQSEQALDDSQKNFRLLLDSTHDAIIMLDHEGTVLNINGQFASRFGKPADQLIGRSVQELIPESQYGDLYKNRKRIMQSVFDTRKPASLEDSRDGRWFDNRFYPVLRGGKVVAVTIFSTDITEKKEHEAKKTARMAQRIQKEEHFKKDREFIEILNSEAQGGYVVDFENHLTHCSEEWIHLLGLTDVPQEQLPCAFFKKLGPADNAMMSEWLTLAQARQMPKYSADFQIRVSDDKTLWVLAQGQLIYNDAGRLVKTYGTFIDITSRKKMELALRRQTKNLREKNRLISNFFLNVSHEFRTPLSVLLMMLDMTDIHLDEANCEYSDGIKKVCGEMRINVYRLLHLVGNILDITKIDAAYDKPNLTNADVVALTSKVVSAVQSHIISTGVRITFSSDQAARIIPADTEKLMKILLNLLSNAVKHSPSGGCVTVNLKNAADSLLIAVRDEGSGIPADMIGVIFDRFRRSGTLTRAQEGCGIGLSLTKGLAELLGGRICAESRPGFGSRFFVELPVLPAPDEPAPFAQEGLSLAQQVQIAFSDVSLQQLNTNSDSAFSHTDSP